MALVAYLTGSGLFFLHLYTQKISYFLLIFTTVCMFRLFAAIFIIYPKNYNVCYFTKVKLLLTLFILLYFFIISVLQLFLFIYSHFFFVPSCNELLIWFYLVWLNHYYLFISFILMYFIHTYVWACVFMYWHTC